MRQLRIILVFMLLATSLLPQTVPRQVHAATQTVPGQYTAIQSAINASSPGDTVLVSPGTYNETLVIQKAIHLIGTSRDTTIIDGRGLASVIWVNASNVEIQGFTIRDSDTYGAGVYVVNSTGVSISLNTIATQWDRSGAGINLFNSNNTQIDRNIFSTNLYAISVTSSSGVIITNNQMISDDTIGVQLEDSQKSLVFNNTFSGGEDGLDILSSSLNNVTRNLVKAMKYFGILLRPDNYSATVSQFPHNNTINQNTFQANHYAGIELQNATLNRFYQNDFLVNAKHVYPVPPTLGTSEINSPNYWDNDAPGGASGNYWDNYTGTDGDLDGIGDTPYVIGAGNMDVRPLMTPFLPVPVLIRSITAYPSSGTFPLQVSLNATIIGTLTPITYLWIFGDGSANSTLRSPNHTYTRAGNYTVTLTVRDTGGSTDTSIFRVSVGTPPSSPGPLSPTTLILVLLAALLGLVLGLVIWRRSRGRSNRHGSNSSRPSR